MAELSDKTTCKQPTEQETPLVLRDALYGERSPLAKSSPLNPDDEAGKIIDLAKNRLDTMDSWFSDNATQSGLSAAKALANEVASLTPQQIADVNSAMIARYKNIYPNFTPVPTGMVNEQGQSVGMEIRASKLDFWPGPQKLQILDDGNMVTVRRLVTPSRVENGKELPPVYIVDAQAARKHAKS